MILKNALYRIVSADTDTKSLCVELMPDHVIYRAHFPDNPITPGVCIIQMATELLQEFETCEWTLHSVSNAKFLSIINPLELPYITYSFKLTPDDDGLKVIVMVHHQGVNYAKLSLIYKKNNG